MLTIKKQGTDKKTYMYGLAAMSVCSIGAIAAMALGGSLTGQVASVSPTKKTVANNSTSAEPSASPSADVEGETTQGSSYQGAGMTTPVASNSSSAPQSGPSSTTPTPTPSETPTVPTPTETPTVPEPTPEPPVEPPVETPAE